MFVKDCKEKQDIILENLERGYITMPTDWNKADERFNIGHYLDYMIKKGLEQAKITENMEIKEDEEEISIVQEKGYDMISKSGEKISGKGKQSKIFPKIDKRKKNEECYTNPGDIILKNSLGNAKNTNNPDFDFLFAVEWMIEDRTIKFGICSYKNIFKKNEQNKDVYVKKNNDQIIINLPENAYDFVSKTYEMKTSCEKIKEIKQLANIYNKNSDIQKFEGLWELANKIDKK